MPFKRFLCSFKYAANGIVKAIRQERNLRFHIVAAIYVFALANMFYNFTRQEYAILSVIVSLVIALELINSAIERLVNKISPQKSKIAADIKDISAAAVLVICTGAVFCGFFLFWDIVVFKSIFAYFAQNLSFSLLFIASLILSLIFIFRK